MFFRIICIQNVFARLDNIFLLTMFSHAFPMLLMYLFHPNFDGQSTDLQDVFEGCIAKARTIAVEIKK